MKPACHPAPMSTPATAGPAMAAPWKAAAMIAL